MLLENMLYLHLNCLFGEGRWKMGHYKGVGCGEELVPKSQIKELETKVRELERVLGKKTLENEILREAVKIAREKKLISRQPLPGLEDFS